MATFPLIDADGHVIEHTSQIIEHMQPPYNDPHPYRIQAGGLFPSLDGWPRVSGFATPGRRDVPDVRAWSQFLDASGLAASVVYPTVGLGFGLIQNKDYAIVLANGYNTWLYERYTKIEPRLRGVALLPVQEPAVAATELRRAVTELGFVGGFLPATNLLGKAYSHTDFDPLLRTAEELGVPLAFHGGPGRGLGFDWADNYIKVHTLAHPFSQMIQLTNVIFDAVLDRFPRLKLIFLEAGCSWIPYLMERMDEEFERRGQRWVKLQKAPSEYVRSGNIYVTCEIEERLLPVVVEQIGADTLLFASDYPHERSHDEYFGDLPHLLGREDLADETKRKILCDNPIRAYNLQSIAERQLAAAGS